MTRTNFIAVQRRISVLGVASGTIGWLMGSRPGIIGRVTMETETVTLWRPTGPGEPALVEASGRGTWSARRPDSPIFYPVLDEE